MSKQGVKVSFSEMKMPPWNPLFSFVSSPWDTRTCALPNPPKQQAKGQSSLWLSQKKLKGPDLAPTQAASTALHPGKQQGERDGGKQRKVRANIQGDASNPP